VARIIDRAISKRLKGFLSFIGWAIGIAVNFWEHHPVLAILTVLLAVVWPIYLFWPELKLLRITYPKSNAKLESPFWLYIFGLASLMLIGVGGYKLYISTAVAARVLTADEFGQPYISNKFFRIVDLADSNGTISNRTFENDWIYGPAVLFARNKDDIGSSYFNTSMAETFIEVTEEQVIGRGGIITVNDSKFRNCHFDRISIIGTKEQIQKWKASNSEKP
jgi:hypothetical protein